MKLEVGMYVRTKSGYILKFEEYVEKFEEYVDWCNDMCFDFQIGEGEAYLQKTITKASFNLIDLIEVGDILKIHLYSEICCIVEVDEIKYEDGSKYIGVYIPWHEGSSFEELKDLDIREVLAKEQYEANCYKVGE